MSTENWSRVKRVFQDAFELPASEREAFLDRACEGDAELRAEVETLLAAGDAGGDVLAAPTEPLLPGGAPAEGPGITIGRYKLLQQIGEGGFGSVYMAEQEKPVRRKVALKIIKLGMDTRQVIARFEAERQALALMDHPNIARVLDAGATETGRPYFVMELVRGIPITEYCDQNHLTTRERLELFQSVCSAVQHAHQKGIIHRDIKPSNVMVTLHDGTPVPKVIDFGIAKATNQQLTEKTLFTEYHQFVGTPQYMSPEQAEMSGLDVDTRTDIYALGVLLYELLTGTTPFDARRLRNLAYSEIHRVIREEEPERPSTRVSTLGQAATATARSRSTDVGALRRALSGDLDWIVMRAIEKDRTRRYDTANSLRLDVERYLHDEPVLASPPSTSYRIRKFARRNRTGVLISSAVVVALVVGIGVATLGLLQARRERAAAAAINAFFTEMLESLNPSPEESWLFTPTLGSDDETGGRKDVSVAEMLREATDRIETSFAEKPLLEAQARETIGKSLLGLDAREDALEQFEKVLEIRRDALGDADREVLRSRLLVAGTLLDLDHRNAAAEMAAGIVENLERYLGEDDPLTLYAASFHASARIAQGNFTAVDSIYEVTLERQRRVLGPKHRDTIKTLLAWTTRHCWSGNGPAAIELASEALEAARETYGPDDPMTRACETYYALGLTFMHRFAEAQAIARPVIERARSSDDPDDDPGLMGFAFVRSLDEDHELDEKESVMLEYFEELRQEGLAGANWVGSDDYAQLLVRRGKLDEALRVARVVYEYWRAATDTVESGLTQGRTDFIRGLTFRRYQSTLAIAGRWDEVRGIERARLVELRTRALADGAGAREWNEYAWKLLTCESPALRDPEEGLAWATRAVEAGEGGDPVELATYMDTRARALDQSGDPEGAFDVASRALRLCEGAEGARRDEGVVSLFPELVRCATRLGREAEAEETLRRIVDGTVTRHGRGTEGAVTALRDAGDALAARGLHEWAEIALRRSVDEARRLGDEKALLESVIALARSRAATGHREESESLLDEALVLYRSLYVREPIEWTPGMGWTVDGERSRESLAFKTGLAFRLLDLGRVDEAAERLHQVRCTQFAGACAHLKGRVLLAVGDAEGALPALRFGLYRSWLHGTNEREPGALARREGEYGHCLSLVGRREEAEAVLLRAHDRAMQWCGPASSNVRDIASWMVDLYEGWGKRAEAARWRDHESLAAGAPVDPQRVGP